LGLEE